MVFAVGRRPDGSSHEWMSRAFQKRVSPTKAEIKKPALKTIYGGFGYCLLTDAGQFNIGDKVAYNSSSPREQRR